MGSSPLGAEAPADVKSLLLSAIPEIDRAVRVVARRYGLSAEDAEDLASDVRVRLIDDDYAALRRFDGRSSLRTYLVTIVHRLLLDDRRRRWGRWRPSAEALHGGPAAVRIEELLYRDGLGLEEAIETVRST